MDSKQCGARLPAVSTSPPSALDSPTTYPQTFPSSLVRHCVASFIPATVFQDMACSAEAGTRYLRPHPEYVEVQRRKQNGLQGNCVSQQGDSVDARELIARYVAEDVGLPPGDVHCVRWLPCFCVAVPRTFALRECELYVKGLVDAMDAASMAAVVALRPRVGERVLDVCCAPGMKLNFLADAVTTTGLVIGVDLSLERLFTTRALVKKHSAPYSRVESCPHPANPSGVSVALFAADGCTVSTQALAEDALDMHERARVRMPDALTAWEDRRLRPHKRSRAASNADEESCTPLAPESQTLPAARTVFAPPAAREKILLINRGVWDGLFDRVLVDVECSHDGSREHLELSAEETAHRTGQLACARVSHTEKSAVRCAETSSGSVTKGLTNHYRMQKMNLARDTNEDSGSEDERGLLGGLAGSLPAAVPDRRLALLQLRLLWNGYEQLRTGGTLVYSTCSFSFWQNEFIIHTFLQYVNARPSAADEAVYVPAFRYAHEQTDTAHKLSPTLMAGAPTEEALNGMCTQLQALLDSTRGEYDIVARGSACCGFQEPLFLGSRLLPKQLQTSCQFVAKIWKRARAAATLDGECGQRSGSGSPAHAV